MVERAYSARGEKWVVAARSPARPSPGDRETESRAGGLRLGRLRAAIPGGQGNKVARRGRRCAGDLRFSNIRVITFLMGDATVLASTAARTQRERGAMVDPAEVVHTSFRSRKNACHDAPPAPDEKMWKKQDKKCAKTRALLRTLAYTSAPVQSHLSHLHYACAFNSSGGVRERAESPLLTPHRRRHLPPPAAWRRAACRTR